MLITVAGKTVSVSVSNGGVFHDKTGKFTANTLKGLQQKMNTAIKVKGAVPVEKSDGSKQGVVISYDSDYNRYRVRWDNAKSSYVYTSDLRRRTSSEEKQHILDLQATSDAAEQAYDAAANAVDDYAASLSVDKLLKQVFGS